MDDHNAYIVRQIQMASSTLCISSAPEEFQLRLTTALEGLQGIICIADDILLYGEGNDYEEAQKDHIHHEVQLHLSCNIIRLRRGGGGGAEFHKLSTEGL